MRIDDPHFTAARLKEWRSAAGWSQATLSARAGIHVQTVKYWERQAGPIGGHAVKQFKAAFLEAEIAMPVPAAHRGGGGRPTDTATPVKQRVEKERCGARTRVGGICQAMPLPGKKRCKFHGGRSTGPKTPEGRERIAAAQRLRWHGEQQA